MITFKDFENGHREVSYVFDDYRVFWAVVTGGPLPFGLPEWFRADWTNDFAGDTPRALGLL